MSTCYKCEKHIGTSNRLTGENKDDEDLRIGIQLQDGRAVCISCARIE